eukprot:9313757-Prorocentrum_lima.AAC.1
MAPMQSLRATWPAQTGHLISVAKKAPDGEEPAVCMLPPPTAPASKVPHHADHWICSVLVPPAAVSYTHLRAHETRRHL